MVNNPFGSVIISDDGFLRGQPNPAQSALNRDRTALTLNATLFFQQLYNDFLSDEESSISVEEFLFISRDDITLRRSIIPDGGIKLNLYFTEVN